MDEWISCLLLSVSSCGDEGTHNLVKSKVPSIPRQSSLNQVMTLPLTFNHDFDTFPELLAYLEPRIIFSGIWRCLP